MSRVLNDTTIHYENTVPRSMVHRAAVSEVFLTGAHRLGDDHFQCAAQLPRTHSYFSEHAHGGKHYDMLLLMEVLRQAFIYVSHAFLGVDPKDKFLYSGSETRLINRSLLRVGNRPTSARIDIRVVDHHWRGSVLAGVTMELQLLIDGEVAARQEGASARWMPSATWNKLRARGLTTVPRDADPRVQRPEPLAPTQVGRHWLSNVVLGRNLNDRGDGFSASLIVDQDNPAIFDHPLDHIPGMLLLEGFRQVALVAAKRYHATEPNMLLLSRCKVTFTRFAEFGLETRYHVKEKELHFLEDGQTIGIKVEVEQDGASVAHAELELAPMVSDHLLQSETAALKMIWFDFGGVLSPPIAELFEQYRCKTGLTRAALERAVLDVASELGVPALAPIENALLSEAEWGRRLAEALRRNDPTVDLSRAQLSRFGQQWFTDVQANSAMIAAVHTLKAAGYKVGILTNNVVEWEPYWRKLIDLDDVIDLIVDSSKEGCRKPDRRFFEIACERSGYKPEQSLLIDDAAENITSAAELGWKTLHFIDNPSALDALQSLTGIGMHSAEELLAS